MGRSLVNLTTCCTMNVLMSAKCLSSGCTGTRLGERSWWVNRCSGGCGGQNLVRPQAEAPAPVVCPASSQGLWTSSILRLVCATWPLP